MTEMIKQNSIENAIVTTAGAGDFLRNGALDQLLLQLIKKQKQIFLVVGPEGDEVLMHSQHAERCELVFDPNFEGQLFSSIKAGLLAVSEFNPGASLLFNFKELASAQAIKVLPPKLWSDFEHVGHLMKYVGCDVLQPVSRDDQTFAPCFPEIITVHGAKRIPTLPAQSNWRADDLVSIFQIPLVAVVAAANLAPSQAQNTDPAISL